MEHAVITALLEVHETAGSISGVIVASDGSERPFSGWLGLLGAVDALVLDGTADPAATPNHSQRKT
jgi:hypothetical protein